MDKIFNFTKTNYLFLIIIESKTIVFDLDETLVKAIALPLIDMVVAESPKNSAYKFQIGKTDVR